MNAMDRKAPPVEPLKRAVTWYDKGSDSFIGEEEISGISLDELRAIFGPACNDDPDLIYVYPVSEREAAALRPWLRHPIDLARYAYFLEATAGASE